VIRWSGQDRLPEPPDWVLNLMWWFMSLFKTHNPKR